MKEIRPRLTPEEYHIIERYRSGNLTEGSETITETPAKHSHFTAIGDKREAHAYKKY